jgi:beta-lactamase class D
VTVALLIDVGVRVPERVNAARFLVALALLSPCACAAPGEGAPRAATAPAPPPERETTDDGALLAIEAHGLKGAFVIHDAASSTTKVSGGDRADARFVPASTYKIPHTLIGLETGVIPDAGFTQRWDGVERSIPAWNRDHDLASAMKHSVVWYYQAIARRIGKERMEANLALLGYGHGDTSAGIDRFWLDDGSLRITPREQVAFLRRLREGKLPVRPASIDTLLSMLVLEQQGDVVFRGKTGGALQEGRGVGWLVGYVDRGSSRFTYALLVLSPPGGDTEAALTRLMPLRKPLARELLVRAGALPESMRDEPPP